MRKLGVLGVLGVIAAGCYREPAAATRPLPQAARTAAEPFAQTAADPLGFLAAKSEVVAHLDARAVRTTPLWARLEPLVLRKAASGLDDFKAACGFDLLSQIERLTLGASELDTKPQLVLVIGGPSRTQVMGCVMRALQSSPALARVERNVVLLPPEAGDQPLAFMFVDERTVLLVSGREAATAAGVRALAERGSPVRQNTQLMALYNREAGSHHAWVYGDGSGFEKLNAMGIYPTAGIAVFDVPAEATAKIVLQMKSPADATALVNQMTPQLAPMKSFVERFDLTAAGAEVIVDFAMTAEQVERMLDLFGVT